VQRHLSHILSEALESKAFTSGSPIALREASYESWSHRESRREWFATSIHVCVVLSELERGQDLRVISNGIRAVAAGRVKWKGWQRGSVALPVFVVRAPSPNALEWAAGPQPKKFADILFPLVVDCAQRASASPTTNEIWGRLYSPYLTGLASFIAQTILANDEE
jgi:hypothetical protein